MRVLAAGLVLLLSLAARADDERRLSHLALDVMIEGQARVMGIADRMRIDGADLCGRNVAPVVGAFAADRKTIDDMYRDKDFVDPFIDAGIERWELTRQPRILRVVPGLPAAEAGLGPGDLVVAVDGKKVRKRVFLDVLRGRGKKGTLQLDVERAGAVQSIPVEVRMGCAIPSRFMHGPDINAFATSFGSLTGIYFYSGLLRYFPDDDHLAMIVGHELAHHVLGHTNQPRTSERIEAEADYLGLYFAARSGFDISVAPEVEEALARTTPYQSIQWGYYSHPISARRSLEQRAAIEEIEGKRSRGESLVPEKGRRWLERPEADEAEVDEYTARLREQALELFRSHQAAIQRVSHRLATAGTDVCGPRTSPVLGATLGRVRDFAHAKQEEVEAAFGVGEEVTVFAVAEGSPAAEAGLRVADRVLEAAGDRVTRTKHVFERLRRSEGGPIALRVGRGDETLELSLRSVPGCEFGVMTAPSTSISTWNHDNEKEMFVPTGLVRFARDDDELAFAIAHQMGHHLVGSFRTEEDEPRADELGLRIAARAGFDVGRAPAFWDRWAAEQFWTISDDMDGTYIRHGAMAVRAPAIRAAVASIQDEITRSGTPPP